MLLFGRRSNDLPVASTSYSGADGSGKAIHMDAPIVRAWKNSSGGTKATYYSLLVCLILIYGGYRHLRYTHASIWLTCHAQDCTLQITPKGRKGTTTVKFPRKQLVKSQTVKINKLGEFVQVDYSRESYAQNYYTTADGAKRKKKRPYHNTKGPDKNGLYDSYTVHMKLPRDNENTAKKFVNLDSIKDFTYESDDGEEVVLQMRLFNIGQSKRRTRTMVTKIESYIRERRHKLTLKENASLSWKGILALVLGLFGILMTALIGQFADDHVSYNGPRVRRQAQQEKKRQEQQKRQQQQSKRRISSQSQSTRSTNQSMRYRPTSGAPQRKKY